MDRTELRGPIGPAAALVAALTADGVDLLDEDAVNDWMEEFNNRPYDERTAVLSGAMMGQAGPLVLVEVPEEGAARASAAAAPLLAEIRQLVQFIGEGRKLTQTGNVTLADARLLVDLISTGDHFDEQIGDKTFKTKSATELPRLSLIVRLAKKARFVRVAKGRLLGTKAGRDLGRDSLADLDRLLAAIDEVGMCSALRAESRYVWASVAPFFDDMFVPLTTRVATDSLPVAFAELVGHAFEQFEAEVQLDGERWSEVNRRRLVESELRVSLEVLQAAGILTWTAQLETSVQGLTKRTGGSVATTPAGQWVLYHYLSATHGAPFAVAPPVAYSDADFETMINACRPEHPDGMALLVRELHAWVDQHGERAVTELVLAARTTEDPLTRAMALATIDVRIGVDSEAQVRGLLDHPPARGAALLWLVEHGCEPREVLVDPDPAVLAEILSLTLGHDGPEGLMDLFELFGAPEAQVKVLQQLWRQTHPAVPDVLDTVGRHHPLPLVAKAARKAAMQYQSHQANRPAR